MIIVVKAAPWLCQCGRPHHYYVNVVDRTIISA